MPNNCFVVSGFKGIEPDRSMIRLGEVLHPLHQLCKIFRRAFEEDGRNNLQRSCQRNEAARRAHPSRFIAGWPGFYLQAIRERLPLMGTVSATIARRPRHRMPAGVLRLVLS